MSDTTLPKGWSLPRLGELMAFKNGLNKGKDYFGHGTPIVNYMDVFNHSGMGKNDIFGLVDVTKDEKKAYSARRGDVFFTRTSETPEEVGISSVLTEELDDAVFSGFVLRGRPRVDRITSGFAEYCFASKYIRDQIVSSATYTTRALTNGRTLSAVRLPLPDDPKEQHAIAEALSDADGVIEGLERLIAKKRCIKQGAMQDLLTARRRLPGFSGGWRSRKLGSVALLQRGFDLPNSLRQDGAYPVVYSNGVMATHTHFMCEGPGVVTGRSGTIGNVTFVSGPYWPHNTALWVKNFFGNDQKFIFYLLEFFDLSRFASGSGVPTLNRNDAHDDEVLVPPTIDEQIAIRDLLDDMDAEITALEARLQKARAIKEGMMQNLLTGRIRLV